MFLRKLNPTDLVISVYYKFKQKYWTWQKNKRIDDAHKDIEFWHFSFPELVGMFKYN